jgi:hypothetical protein
MNERETEARLRDWIEAQASPAVPDDLRRAVAAIPATVALPWSERLGASFGWRPAAVPRLAWVLLLAGLLLALVVGSLAVGARRPDRTPVAPVPGFAWVRLPDDAAQFGDAVVSSVTAGGPGFVAVGLVYDDDGSAISLYRKLGFEHIILPALEPGLAAEGHQYGRRRIVMCKSLSVS